jgi:hypothetical protein
MLILATVICANYSQLDTFGRSELVVVLCPGVVSLNSWNLNFAKGREPRMRELEAVNTILGFLADDRSGVHNWAMGNPNPEPFR